jgi:hypothetical protein
MRAFLIAPMAVFGLVLGSFGFIRSTWMQVRTPREMLGRMMSMMMLSNTGLVPISQAISGAVSKWSLTILFAGAGVLILLVTLLTAPQHELKTFSDSMVAGKPELKPEAVPGGE